jgi:mannosyltransferase OCH1-like enzyme
VGKKPIPEIYKKYMKTWTTLHPDWEYRLWTDKDVDDFPWTNKKLFLQAENPGMKSDIWRYEIVNQYGGLYVDTDMEAIRSFEKIHERLEFYAGHLGPGHEIACGIFASKPNSPILLHVIKNLKKSISLQDFTKFDPNAVMEATGPMFFTRMINSVLPKLNPYVNIIFTQEYFQPVECYNRGIPKFEYEFYNIEHMCFCIDHNGCSWL